MAAGWKSGSEIVRALAQAGALPDVTRLSDESETEISLALSGTEGLKRSRSTATWRFAGAAAAACSSSAGRASASRSSAGAPSRARLIRAGGAAGARHVPGKSWEHGRFDGPYLRDELMDLGYLVETLETSHTWSRLGELYDAVGAAIARRMRGRRHAGIVMCHLSHAYADGASLYFTFVCRAARR